MFTIDLTIRYSPLPLSVQKKEESDAQALYEKILSAMTADKPEIIELTCDKQEDKKIAIIGNQVNSVILSSQSGSASGERVPGFFAAIAEKK